VPIMIPAIYNSTFSLTTDAGTPMSDFLHQSSPRLVVDEEDKKKGKEKKKKQNLSRSVSGNERKEDGDESRKERSRSQTRKGESEDDEKVTTSVSDKVGRRNKVSLQLSLTTEDAVDVKKPGFFAKLSPRRSRSPQPKSQAAAPTAPVDLQTPKVKEYFHVTYINPNEDKTEKVLFLDLDGIKLCNSLVDLQGQLHPISEISDFSISKHSIKWICRGKQCKVYTEQEEEIQQMYLDCLKQANNAPKASTSNSSITISLKIQGKKFPMKTKIDSSLLVRDVIAKIVDGENLDATKSWSLIHEGQSIGKDCTFSEFVKEGEPVELTSE